jgi:outer membrane usher protein
MSAARLNALICASALFAPQAWAEEAFITQLRLPARGQSADVFAWRDERGVSVERDALMRLGIAAPPGARVRLADVPGLTYAEHESAGAIVLTCAAACFATQRVGARAAPTPSSAPPWGGYVNYDLAADWREGEGAALGAVLEANLFGPAGRGEASWIAQTESGFTRLETRWTVDAPARRLRLRVGDSALPSLDGGVSHFAGVQIGRHFALAPRAINHPTPRLSGEAESASTVELYIDGALRSRARVEAGPFELEDAPFVSGAGDAQLVVTDMLGRQQIITRPFFVSTAMLRPGLSDWSIAAGVSRRGFGRESFAYGDRFATGRYRVGLANALTAEIGAEWSDDGVAAQAGAAFTDPRLGQISVSYARGGDGGAAGFAWMRDARAWSFAVQAQARDADFASLGRAQGARTNAAASLNLRLGGYGDLSLTAAGAAFDRGPAARFYTLSYSPDARRVALTFRLAYTERDRAELAFGVGLSVPLAGDVSASAAAEWDRRGVSYRASAQSAAPTMGGVGWRARAASDERFDAALSYRGAGVDAQARAAHSRLGAAMRLELAGAVGWIEDSAFAGRAIHGAFALVDVGAPGVGVSRDRLRVGVSGADGRVLAANLRPHDANIIAMDAEDLPLDRAPGVIALSVSPAEGAGVVVRFRDAALTIVDTHVRFADGAPAPRGAVLIRVRDGARFPVGGAGRIVIQGAGAGDELRLESDARCVARAEAGRAGLVLTCAGAA